MKKLPKKPFSALVRLFKRHRLRILWIVIISSLLTLFPAPNHYFQTVSMSDTIAPADEVHLPPPPAYPYNQTEIPAPELTARGVMVKDMASGVSLYAKNEHERFSPASTTKIMTALVAMDYFGLEDVLTVNTVIKQANAMGLVPGEKITLEALLYGALVFSANDAAYTIAENYPGGVEKFVEAMNAKAKELHMDETQYANSIGFDHPSQYTTASDLSKVARVGLANKTFAKIVSTRSITVSDVSFTYFHDLRNVNQLLGKVAGVSGVKTGYTESAGEVLVSEVNKNGHQTLIVILNSDDRFGETRQLIDWVYGNFVWIKFDDIIPTTHF